MLLALPCRLDNFRRHPEHGTLHGCMNAILVDICGSFRYTEIRNLANARRIDEDVVSFQILRIKSETCTVYITQAERTR